MRSIFAILPLVVLITACTNNDSLENKGQEAGAAVDNAMERISNRVEAERDDFDSEKANVSDMARDVKQDVKEGWSKADNAVDAAAAELKK
jgi:hypothetical protein